LIKEDGLILIDAGSPKHGQRFLKALGRLSINPKAISLLIITHCHFDHIGSANEIREITRCKVAINKEEKDWAEQARKIIPPTVGLWGKVVEKVTRILMSRVKLAPTPIDLVLEEEFSLKPYGIGGRVFCTPGHSPGSMSVLLDSGEAFVGDLAVNGSLMRKGPGLPLFVEDIATLKESWQLLLDKGAKQFFPAHGAPFGAEKAAKFK